jgi:signal transduction histidine kinase
MGPSAGSNGAAREPVTGGAAETTAANRRLRALQAGEPARTREELVAESERPGRPSRLQSELVATVARELRTPLATIVGFTELLRNRELDAAAHQHFVGIVNDEARRLARLVDELCDVQLILDGASDLRIGVFDLADVLRGQVELFCVESSRHVLRVDVPEGALLVRGDRDRLTQVVASLLSNAIECSPEGGVVAVAAAVLDGTVRVSVRDGGIGLAPGRHHPVFARFDRADDARPAASRSVGLGLALSREIVRSHGGSFGFDSAVDEGSTFYFELRDAVVREERS